MTPRKNVKLEGSLMDRKFEAVTQVRSSTSPVTSVLVSTLGIGLVAIAAVTASLLIGRSRSERSDLPPVPKGAAAPPALSLDELRAAGF